MFISAATKIYNCVITILLPLLFLRLFIKSLKLKAYRDRWYERLGIFASPNTTNGIWIHAVSVGEIMAAMPIIQKIQQKYPNLAITVTCSTPTGSSIIKQQLSTKVFHVYFPFDASFTIKNFLKRIKPKLLIILEKEIWPNVISICQQQGIPIIIANAQISNKSFRRYLLIKPLVASWLKTIAVICTQTKFDAYKFKKLLVNNDAKNIIIAGNTKFDLAAQQGYANDNSRASNIQNSNNNVVSFKPIWIAASTHPGEEELILQAHQQIVAKIPNALLILCPRHSERCLDLIKKINLFNFTCMLRSKQSSIDCNTINTSVFLIDSMGELNLLYGMSHAAFVGGSLVPQIGGHNVLEPAALSIPIAVGPYTANCKQMVFRMKLADGLVVVKSADALAALMIQWLIDKPLRDKVGHNAKNYLYSQAGATDIITKLCYGYIESIPMGT